MSYVISMSLPNPSLAQQVQSGCLSLGQLLVEEDDGVVKDGDLVHQSLVWWIIAGLNVGPMASLLKSGLGYF